MLDKDQSVPVCGHFLTCCMFFDRFTDNLAPLSNQQQALTYKMEPNQQNSVFISELRDVAVSSVSSCGC